MEVGGRRRRRREIGFWWVCESVGKFLSLRLFFFFFI
jgi:hypothetical protein